MLTEAMAKGGAEAKRAFAATMELGKIDVAAIKAARLGKSKSEAGKGAAKKRKGRKN